jgi:putative DNA primase/helicase
MTDYRAIADAALRSSDAVIGRWLPGGKYQGREYLVRNPTRNDERPGSFSVNLDTGKWADFATDSRGGDLVSLVAYLQNTSQAKAAEILAQNLGLNGTRRARPKPKGNWRVLLPVPDSAPPPPEHPKLGRPTTSWTYRDGEGRILCHVLRFETEGGGKEFRPLTLCESEGQRQWRWQGPPEPRPLYGLDRLAANPDAPVIVAEGEKAADAAAELLPDHVAVSPMNGARSPRKADWAPLRGRKVYVWPDADEPGLAFAATVQKLTGAAILDLSDMREDPPQGWDAADALAEGIRPQIKELDEAALLAAEIERLALLDPVLAKPEISAAAKAHGWDLHELRKRIKAKRKDSAESSGINTDHALDPLAARLSALGNPLGDVSEYSRIKPGDLLEESGESRTRMVESRAAEVLATALRDRFCWDCDAQAWLKWQGTHWQKVTAAAAERAIVRSIHVGVDDVGYRMSYASGITGILRSAHLLPLPARPAGVVPFSNGLLDIKTRELEPARPDYALDWCLPHACTPEADCPAIKEWLLRATGDAEVVELLRAWWAALLRELPLQRFLLLLGRGGTSKGTFQRLTVALIGEHNAATTTLHELETNRFESGIFYGRKLAMVNEAGRHGGSVNMLKALTGQDWLRREEKHVQQIGQYIFHGQTLLATNDEVRTTDSTSGLERRRVTVVFGRTATPEERADWEARGGEQGVLHVEIPGLVNWVLELSETDIRARFENLPAAVVAANVAGMAAGNSVAEWMMDNTYVQPGHLSQIGILKETRRLVDGLVVYEHADDWLFPNYVRWCRETGRANPVSARKFKTTVLDISETLGHRLTDKEHPEKRTRCIDGIVLKPLATESFRPWDESRREHDREPKPAPREDRELREGKTCSGYSGDDDVPEEVM